MKVSIVITCYNREQFISRAIRSAISQRFSRPDFEVIVVDDGSSDHSREIIDDFGEEVIPIYHSENRGLPAARNSGIKKARGRFVVHLDSDDYFHEELVNIEYLHLAMNPHWGAVSCDYFLVDAHERHLKRMDGAQHPIACGLMFRKEALIKLGLYDEAMRLYEDEDLRARYTAEHQIGHVNLPLYRYTDHGNNMTNNVEALFEYRCKFLDKHPDVNGGK